MLVPLALVFTAFWCITAPFREAFIFPFLAVFRCQDAGFGAKLNWSLIGVIANTILIPFKFVAIVVGLPKLLYKWVKSAVVGFKKLVAYVVSDQSKILASNRLYNIYKNEENEPLTEEVGSQVETGIGATLGYMIGVYNFDVSLSKNVTSENQVPILEEERMIGCKWY